MTGKRWPFGGIAMQAQCRFTFFWADFRYFVIFLTAVSDLHCSDPLSSPRCTSRFLMGGYAFRPRESPRIQESIMSTPFKRLLSKAAVLTSAAALATTGMLSGCTYSDPSEGMHTRTLERRSVETSDVTRIPDASQSNVMNFPTGDARNSVLRVEQVTPREVRQGVQYTYQVKITNLTDKPLQNVVLKASRPEGLKVLQDDNSRASQQNADGWTTYEVGALPPRDTRTFQVTGTPTGTGVIRQTYDVKYEQQMATAVTVTAPVLAITKEGPKDVDICHDLRWVYNVTNTGTGVARNATLRDTLPEGLLTLEGQNAVSADLGDIPGGQTRQVIAKLKASHSGQFASAAVVHSDAGEAKSAVITTIAKQPRLEVAIKGPDRESLGKSVTYQATVTNKGDAAAQDVSVRFDASDRSQAMDVTDATGGRLAAARSGPDRNLGTLDAGQSKTINVSFQPTQGGDLRVNAIAAAPCATQVSNSAQTNIMSVAALLLEAVDVQDPVKVGDTVVYKIKVTNQGNGPDSNIRVVATLPDGEEFVSATGVTDSTRDGQKVTFSAVQTLQAKQSATWEVSAKAVRAGDVQFKVSAVSDSVKAAAEKTEPTKLY
jgi:uncharacterized repeat protein (TIGR01451 family)